MDKEQVYDERIAPLMNQIKEICLAHDIAFVAAYSTPTSEDEGLRCISVGGRIFSDTAIALAAATLTDGAVLEDFQAALGPDAAVH